MNGHGPVREICLGRKKSPEGPVLVPPGCPVRRMTLDTWMSHGSRLEWSMDSIMSQTLWRALVALLAAGTLTLLAGACTPRGSVANGDQTPIATTSGSSYYVTTPVPGTYRLTQADDGKTIELLVGQEFLVSLSGSTSHTYRITEIDKSILKQVGSVSLGEGWGRGVFRIQAVGPGDTTIQFEYGPLRSPDTRTKLTVHVTVR